MEEQLTLFELEKEKKSSKKLSMLPQFHTGVRFVILVEKPG
jgi:hypothetical protein